jgi:hypothetical protein
MVYVKPVHRAQRNRTQQIFSGKIDDAVRYAKRYVSNGIIYLIYCLETQFVYVLHSWHWAGVTFWSTRGGGFKLGNQPPGTLLRRRHLCPPVLTLDIFELHYNSTYLYLSSVSRERPLVSTMPYLGEFYIHRNLYAAPAIHQTGKIVAAAPHEIPSC